MPRDTVWETDYRADRRKHCHRCAACSRVIQPGERVLMGRRTAKKGGGTKAVHLGCADLKAWPDGSTYRSWLHLLGIDEPEPLPAYGGTRADRARHQREWDTYRRRLEATS